MQRLLAERTAEVVVQTPLHTVLTEGVSAGGGDRLVEQPEDHREFTTVRTHKNSQQVVNSPDRLIFC